MAIGIIGRKSGMTRVFAADGESVPVTVIEIEPNRITLIRTPDRDGYHGVQVTTGTRRRTRVTRPQAGHFAAAGVEAGRGVWEFRLADAAPELVVGGDLPLSQFEAGMVVDVTGTSKGKGYAGAIRRWNFRGQDNTHGNSVSHRAPGSIGQCQTPGRVFKGKKMSGHLGAERVTTQRLDIVRVDLERGLLLIRGAIPGAPGGDVIVRPSTKVRAKRAA